MRLSWAVLTLQCFVVDNLLEGAASEDNFSNGHDWLLVGHRLLKGTSHVRLVNAEKGVPFLTGVWCIWLHHGSSIHVPMSFQRLLGKRSPRYLETASWESRFRDVKKVSSVFKVLDEKPTGAYGGAYTFRVELVVFFLWRAVRPRCLFFELSLRCVDALEVDVVVEKKKEKCMQKKKKNRQGVELSQTQVWKVMKTNMAKSTKERHTQKPFKKYQE